MVNATPRKRTGTHCIGGWVGPRAGLENLDRTGIRSPERPDLSESLYRLSHPGPKRNPTGTPKYICSGQISQFIPPHLGLQSASPLLCSRLPVTLGNLHWLSSTNAVGCLDRIVSAANKSVWSICGMALMRENRTWLIFTCCPFYLSLNTEPAVSPKRLLPLTQRHSVASWKTRILSNTAVRNTPANIRLLTLLTVYCDGW